MSSVCSMLGFEIFCERLLLLSMADTFFCRRLWSEQCWPCIWRVGCVVRWNEVASFPGPPHAQTKNRKERGDPGKIYYVRNVIGRELNYMWANEWTHPPCMDRYSRSVAIAGGPRWHYATLLGSTESYGEHTQTRTFESHANLLTYLANWLLFTPENGSQGAVKH